MQIKCENCFIVYEVSEKHLSVRRPRFFRCTSCGHTFETHLTPTEEKQTLSSASSLPPIEQTDTVPMSLSDIFNTPENTSVSTSDNTENNQDVSLYSSKETYFVEKNEIEQTNEAVQATSFIENITINPTDPISETIKQAVQPTEETNPNPQDPHSALFAPFDKTDEFTPLSEHKKSTAVRFVVILLTILFIFGALGYLFYVSRFYFVRQVSVPTSVYKNIGIDTDITGEGLTFQDTTFDVLNSEDTYALMIKSNLFNTTGEIKNVPIVAVYLKDENDTLLQKELVSLEKETLESGESLPFEQKISPINKKTRRIEITFEKDSK